MAADVKFTVKKATDDQVLIPATVSEDLEQTFVKKARAFSIKLIPVSILVAAIVLALVILAVIYDAFATSKAIKNHDYEFFYGEIIGKTDSGNYVVRGLEELKIGVLFGKKEYNAGDRALVARIKDDLNIISEE